MDNYFKATTKKFDSENTITDLTKQKAMATEMSITQGLAELKLLDKRINKLVFGPKGKKAVSRYSSDETDTSSSCFAFIDVKTKSHPVDVEALKSGAHASYQSFCDLVKRHGLIKRAIIMKNAVTQVKIGSWTGTVAEAIEHKSSILFKEHLLEEMKNQVTLATAKMEKEQNNLTDRLDNLLSSEMGKDVRTNPDTINALTTSFLENNKVTIVDPLNSKKLIADLEEEVESFKTNVDWVLSEINGKTLISV